MKLRKPITTATILIFLYTLNSYALSGYAIGEEVSAPSPVTPETQGRFLKGRIGVTQSRNVYFLFADDTGPNPVVSNDKIASESMGISLADFSGGIQEWVDLLIKVETFTTAGVGVKLKAFGPSYEDRRYKLEGTPFSLSFYFLYNRGGSYKSLSSTGLFVGTESRSWKMTQTQESLGFSAGQRLNDDFLIYLNPYYSQFRAKGSLHKVDTSIGLDTTYNYGVSGTINGLYLGGEYDIGGNTQFVVGAVIGYSKWSSEIGGDKSYTDAGLNLAWNW